MVFKLERRISGKIQRNVFLIFEQFSRKDGLMKNHTQWKLLSQHNCQKFRETNAFTKKPKEITKELI